MFNGSDLSVEDGKAPVIGGFVDCRRVEERRHVHIGHYLGGGLFADWVIGEMQACAAEKANFIENVMKGDWQAVGEVPRFGGGDGHAGKMRERKVHFKSVNAEVRTECEHSNIEHKSSMRNANRVSIFIGISWLNKISDNFI